MNDKPECKNIMDATGDELIWLRNNRCNAHGHRYISHFNCFLREQDIKESIGILDIEATQLTAEWGYMLCYCILPLEDNPLIYNVIKPSEVRNPNKRDKRILEQFCKDVKKFDTLIVYYGKDNPWRFDIPFLRARASKWDVAFPKANTKKVIDVYDTIKTKYKLQRKRLVNACTWFNIPSKQTKVTPETWQNAAAGIQEDINKILQHCKEDVWSLKELYKKVYEYKSTKSNI